MGDEAGHSRFHWRAWLLGLLLVAALVVAVLHWGDLEKFAELLQHARPGWLLVAVALQVSTYASLSAEWALVLHHAGSPRPFRKLFPLTITKLFADQVVPTAGMSGNVLLVDRLVAIGVPRGHAVAALLLSVIAYYAAYAMCAIAVLVMLWLHHDASPLLAGIVTLLLLVAGAVPALAFWLQRRGRAAMPKWLGRFKSARELFALLGQAPDRLMTDWRLIAQITLLNALVFLADAGTMMAALAALGRPAAFGAAFIAFMMASIVVTLGPIPLGLGSFEAMSIGMLRSLGIPFEAALSATLLFRGFALWLPLVPGLFLMRRAFRHSHE